MTAGQKVIKCLALAFAVFLGLTIISAILSALYALIDSFGLIKNNDRSSLSKNLEVIASKEVQEENIFNIEKIEIEISASSLEIKLADNFKVETNNKEINYKEEKDKIIIKEKEESDWWFFREEYNSNVIIYLPEKEFEEVKIKSGAGKIKIDALNTKEFELKQGAGETEIGSLVASKKVEIDGGAGEIKIEDGKINNLEVKQGVGRTYIKAAIYGENNIKCGIGALDLYLKLPMEAYKIKVDKGIGRVTVDEMQVGSDTVLGMGNNKIKIKGGIGNIQIKTNQE